MIDFEKIIAGTTSLNSDSGSVLANKLNSNFGKVNDELTATNDVMQELESDVREISNISHSHSNKDTIDKFSEINGKPAYDGQPIGGSGVSTGISEAPIDGHQYARQNGGWSVVTGEGGSGSNPDNPPVIVYNPMTYAELKQLVEYNELQPNTKYTLIDYVSTYRRPYNYILLTADNKGTVERLVLTAKTSNEFNSVCESLDYPNDRIYYDFNDIDAGYTDGVGFVFRNGYIQRRIDTKNNIDIPFDWRTMVFYRYKMLPPTWSGGYVNMHHYYLIDDSIYKTIRYGIPSDNDDFRRNYTKYVCHKDSYAFTGSGSEYEAPYLVDDGGVQRYLFNASTDFEKKEPTKHDEGYIKNIVLVDSHIDDCTFYFDSYDNAPSDIYMYNSFFGKLTFTNCVKHNKFINYYMNQYTREYIEDEIIFFDSRIDQLRDDMRNDINNIWDTLYSIQDSLEDQ